MAVLGERFGARVDRVVFAQSLRVLIVVIVVPFAFAYSGVHGADAYSPIAIPVDGLRLLLLLGFSVMAGALFALLGAPNPFMFGPLLAAIALTVGGVELSSIPGWASNLGQMLLGCALATRFEREFLSGLGRYAGAVLASIVLAMLLAALFGAGLAWIWGVPVPSLILATAPGGIAEMCITAKVLQLGVPLVTAAHVTRVLILINATAPIFRMAKRWTSERQA